jgi:hypothetical protein
VVEKSGTDGSNIPKKAVFASMGGGWRMSKKNERDGKIGGKECSAADPDPTRDPEILKSSPCAELLYFYSRQFNPYSCSAASAAIVINSIRARLNGLRAVVPVKPVDLLSAIRVANWKERVSMGGFHGSHGLSVPQLGMVMEAALKHFSIPFEELETVRIRRNMENLAAEKTRLLSLLTKNCRDKNRYIVAHFTQGVLVGDWFGGHISPVGAFDPQTRRVFVLDVDEEIDGPYWTSFDLFFEGLVGASKTLGPREGGYVSVTLPKGPV